jgi:hypothetical protein
MRYEDFDSVIQMLPKVANQAQIKYILASDSPAETGYMFIKASPEYIKTLTQDTVKKTAEETIEKINRNSSSVKTLSKSGAGNSKPESVFRNMSDEELDRLTSAIKLGGKDTVKKYFGG